MPETADLTVRRLMTPDPARVAPGEPVQSALDLMNSRRIGAVLIVEPVDKLVGIFTERDFLRQAFQAGIDWHASPIRDWMSPLPYTIHPDAGWEEAVASLERLRVRHLPVVEDAKVVGIITTRQLMAHRADHLNQLVGERMRQLKRLNDDLMSRDAELTHYMKAAARLQKRLVLPQSPPDWPEVAWGAHFAPLDPLGGDLYGFARPDDDHLGVFIADASGHGIPAAMVAIMTRLAFVEASRGTSSPGEVLAAMNQRLLDLADERFVTAFYGVLDRKSRRFTYANAGHPFPIWYSAKTKSAAELPARGFLLGVMPEEVYVERSVDLEPGDRLCLFTDGVADCRDERGETFGHDRVRELLPSLARLPASQITDRYVAELNNFRGAAKALDDMTLVVAEMR
ncbi:MAG TPA: SpoIIE family protein phosphatase [Gemmataceae bacterium]|nr:SpoIIE family protein phosphatase [Gemmataceae bacterium]